jgi:crotonyl-CoA reductase
MCDYYIPGSDASGHVVEIKGNSEFKEGDEVIVHCAAIASKDLSMKDSMLSNSQSVWGYETNFGSFAEYAIVKTSQLIKKPKNLSWAASGCFMLTLGTAYRMLATKNGLDAQSGQTCLIWGASGGLGIFAIQICNAIGVEPICVVSNNEKAEYCKKFGAKKIINLEKFHEKNFISLDGNLNMTMWLEFSQELKTLTGEKKVDLVFEHIGKETMALSIYVLKRGGKVVTCAATSGYLSTIDLRYLWMEMKKLIHGIN